MKVIRDPIAAVQSICGEQKKSDSSTYRLTKHCVEVACDEGRLFFHTLTGSLILSDHEEDMEDHKDRLIKNWFLVPTTFDEVVFADKVLYIAALLRAKKTDTKAKKTFTILTTTECNARCYYCYEAGIRRSSMTAETARAVSDYIERVSLGNEVELHWFGGEPLLNPSAIDWICQGLLAKKIRYKATMISNGYSLDRFMIDKGVKLWNLEKLQITLDGTREAYNRIKAYVDAPDDAYERVLQNIETALNANIEVHIRLNLGLENGDELMRLVDELALRFKRKRGLLVYPAFLFDFKKKGNGSGFTDRMEGELLEIKDKLKAHGFEQKPDPLPCELKSNHCKADNDSCEIILPDGRLCKCEYALLEDSYGSIYTQERDIAKIEAWKERVKLPACFDCPLYPMCINLKKCTWVESDCSKIRQSSMTRRLKQQMLDAYNDWREKSHEVEKRMGTDRIIR